MKNEPIFEAIALMVETLVKGIVRLLMMGIKALYQGGDSNKHSKIQERMIKYYQKEGR